MLLQRTVTLFRKRRKMAKRFGRPNILNLLFSILFLSGFGHELFAQAQFVTIPEMQSLPFESFDPLSQDYQISTNEQNSWLDFYPFVTDQIHDQLVQDLSRWAVNETRLFHYVPGYPAPLTLYGANSKQVIYTSVLANLPVHTPLVTRQLVVYIVGLNHNHLFLPNMIVITIRGNRNE